jgi:hypothetical protein
VVTRSTADYRFVNNRMQKHRLAVQNRGLNRNYNHRLKSVLKAAALDEAHSEAYREYYERLVTAGTPAPGLSGPTEFRADGWPTSCCTGRLDSMLLK